MTIYKPRSEIIAQQQRNLYFHFTFSSSIKYRMMFWNEPIGFLLGNKRDVYFEIPI